MTECLDLEAILERKRQGRRDLARRTFGEKIADMEALRDRVAPLKALREDRRAAEADDAGSKSS